MRALLSDGAEAERYYREALSRLGRSRAVMDLARTQLLYGEWLHTQDRAPEAREQLSAAHGRFAQIGAEGYAGRARRGLAGCGVTVPGRRRRRRWS